MAFIFLVGEINKIQQFIGWITVLLLYVFPLSNTTVIATVHYASLAYFICFRADWLAPVETLLCPSYCLFVVWTRFGCVFVFFVVPLSFPFHLLFWSLLEHDENICRRVRRLVSSNIKTSNLFFLSWESHRCVVGLGLITLFRFLTPQWIVVILANWLGTMHTFV